MSVRCQCQDGHRDHEFTPSLWGLCGVCSHNVAAHRPTRPNDEVADRIVRLLRVYDIGQWTVHPGPDGLDVTLHLVPAANP
jgi:hypothetical protein